MSTMASVKGIRNKFRGVLLNFALFSLCFLLAPLDCAKVQLVEPKSRSPVLEEGSAFRMLCKGDREVEKCLFKFGQKEVTLEEGQTGPSEFKYFGSGLHRGECGVEWFNLTGTQQGDVTCDLRYLDGSRDTLKVDLSVDREPHNVTATTNRVKFKEGEVLEVTCSATGGRPDHYTYSAWIDSEELDLASYDSGDKFSRKVKVEDCGKPVFCKGQNRVLKPPKDSDKTSITVTGFPPFSVEKDSEKCRMEGSEENQIKVQVKVGDDFEQSWTYKNGTALNAAIFKYSTPVPLGACVFEFGLELPTEGFGWSYNLSLNGNKVYACHAPKPSDGNPSLWIILVGVASGLVLLVAGAAFCCRKNKDSDMV